VLINLLPNTAETVGIINETLLNQLADQSYLMNLARGVHLVEPDLLKALDSGKLKAPCWMSIAVSRCRWKARCGRIRAWR
jgi:phosphoglycerate dehydrogenase-like enzyme